MGTVHGMKNVSNISTVISFTICLCIGPDLDGYRASKTTICLLLHDTFATFRNSSLFLVRRR